MIVLVCGGRDYKDYKAVAARLCQPPLPSLIIHGGAPGADKLAQEFADIWGIHTAEVRAQWDYYGRAAGPLRNMAMLHLRPDKVVACPGGRGTENCLGQAEALGIPVERVEGADEATQAAPDGGGGRKAELERCPCGCDTPMGHPEYAQRHGEAAGGQRCAP